MALTAVALSLSAYFFTSTVQEKDALDKALAQSRFNLFLADSLLPTTPAEQDYNRLLSALQIRGDFATLIMAGEDTYVSGPEISRALI
ncbi:MAG: hypothetical protein H5T84_10795, partial [Thermoleophilia bacterium]|nr:hypothetical protein [Thermoleophilia bacterium]